MDISKIILHIEALIFASDKPLTALELTEFVNNTFGFMEDKTTLDQVDSAIEGIVDKYNSEFYPFEMKESGGGWQFLTKKQYHKTVAQLNGEKFLKRLSAASLETLSIIAYKQPVTKGDIESIRGVNSDYSIQKLLEKELVIISGRNEELPGKPLVYATSRNFMDYFGINSADDLPRIKEVLADQVVEPTLINAEVKKGKEESEDARHEVDLFNSEMSIRETEADNKKEDNGSRNQLKDAGPEYITETEPVQTDEEISLVVRGNGELIEETFIVTEDTGAVDPEITINPENNFDDSGDQQIKQELNEEDNDSKDTEV